jgi:Na+-transporting methylmalonyl-CoA/oxaloacetate decarboxylase gamma subunit
MRNFYKNNSKSSIIKEYENYYANYYSKIKIVDEPSVNDNVSKNEFIVTESYVIDSIWQTMQLEADFKGIEFIPSSLTDILYVPNMGNRKNEMSLPYPVSREHRTNIILPSEWQIKKEDDVISNDIFYYNFTVDYDKKNNEVQLKNYLKIQKASFTPEEFTTYYNDLNKLDKSFGYTIFVPKNSIALLEESAYLTISKVAFFLLLLGAFIIFLVWILTKKKNKPVEVKKEITNQQVPNENNTNYLTEVPEDLELHSKRVIYVFSTVFSSIFGAVLLMYNMKQTDNQKGRIQVLIFGILYTIAGIVIINQLNINTNLTLLFNIMGAVILNEYFWNKYIGKHIKFRHRSWIKPAIISVIIIIPFILAIMYG